MPRTIRVEPGTMAYAMTYKTYRPIKMQRRTVGKLVATVYESKARAKGLGYNWSYQPRHAFKGAVKVLSK
jgi:hypothetical protein